MAARTTIQMIGVACLKVIRASRVPPEPSKIQLINDYSIYAGVNGKTPIFPPLPMSVVDPEQTLPIKQNTVQHWHSDKPVGIDHEYL